MRSLRPLLAVAGVTALLAVPTGADAAAKTRAVGFQAKVVSINAKHHRLKGRVLLASGNGLSRYRGRTLTFDLRRAKLTVSDTNGDGRANSLADIKRGDLVGLTGTARTGRLPKVIKIAALNDLTALLPTPNLPSRRP